MLTSEAVRGAEGYKGDDAADARAERRPPVHPQRDRRDGLHAGDVLGTGPGQTSAAHELALSVVFESGLQHFADSPERYAARAARGRAGSPASRRRGTTRGCSTGRPGAAATLARRSGDRWYVGSIHAGAAGTQQAPARLPRPRPARTWPRSWPTPPATPCAAAARRVTAASTLAVPYARDGGFVVRIRPAVDRHGELAPGDVEHDRLALARGDGERHVRVARRERRRRHRAAAERAGEREHRVGEQLDAPDRRGQLARLGIGAQRARRAPRAGRGSASGSAAGSRATPTGSARPPSPAACRPRAARPAPAARRRRGRAAATTRSAPVRSAKSSHGGERDG